MIGDENLRKYKKVNSIQVLIATMEQKNSSLLEKMNIQTDVIVGNQSDRYYAHEFKFKQCNVKWIETSERGVGLNRNITWMNSTSDIVVFADDDMLFKDGYEKIVVDLFNENPKADVIIFNLDEVNSQRKITKKQHYTKKIGYGAARIAIRREKAHLNGINFNVCFGGGTKYSCGEDTLFLRECIKKGLKILVVPISIAELTNERPSTWFVGENDKFCFDKGVLLANARISFLYIRIIKAVFLKKNKTIKEKRNEFNTILKGVRFFKSF